MLAHRVGLTSHMSEGLAHETKVMIVQCNGDRITRMYNKPIKAKSKAFK